MNDKLDSYYSAALNKTTFEDSYMQGMWDTAMYAIREFGDEVLRLEAENAKLRALVKRASKSTSYDDCDCLAVTGRLCFPCECKEALK